MKKVGILTYHACFNFGACLQAYALLKTVQKYEPDCQIIDYQSDTLRNISNVFSKRPRHPKELIKNFTRLPYHSQLMRRQKMFEDFINNFDLSRRCKTESDVKKQVEEYETVICGSDQTWNMNPSIRYQNPVYFLNFPKKQKRVSYATSFGQWVEKAPMHEEMFLPWVSEYDALSMREQSGVDYLQSKGLDCKLVLDPTLLLKQQDYDAICAKRQFNEPYVLLFSWDGSKDCIEIAKRVGKEYGVKPIYIVPPPRAMFSGIKRKLDVGPGEFLSLVKNAEFVVTNSFHGTVFSIIFKKKFISVTSTYDDKRRQSLMQHMGLTDHLMSIDNFDLKVIENTNFDIVDEKLKSLKKKSLEYLRKILGE